MRTINRVLSTFAILSCLASPQFAQAGFIDVTFTDTVQKCRSEPSTPTLFNPCNPFPGFPLPAVVIGSQVLAILRLETDASNGGEVVGITNFFFSPPDVPVAFIPAVAENFTLKVLGSDLIGNLQSTFVIPNPFGGILFTGLIRHDFGLGSYEFSVLNTATQQFVLTHKGTTRITSLTSVPEPSALALLMIGFMPLIWLRRKLTG